MREGINCKHTETYLFILGFEGSSYTFDPPISSSVYGDQLPYFSELLLIPALLICQDIHNSQDAPLSFASTKQPILITILVLASHTTETARIAMDSPTTMHAFTQSHHARLSL